MIALSIYRSPIILSSLRFISKTAQNLTSAFVFLCALPSPGLLATCSSGNLHIHVILQNFFFFYSTLQRCRTFKFSDWNTDFLMPSSVYLLAFLSYMIALLVNYQILLYLLCHVNLLNSLSPY